MYAKLKYETKREQDYMKHISSYLGESKKTYTKKRAVFPFKSTSGEWILPFQCYYVAMRYWANALTDNGIIQNKRYLTAYEFILESFSKNNT